MNFFSCCMSEDKVKRTDSNSNSIKEGTTKKDDKYSKRHLTSFANISLKTDSSKRRYITNELARAGKELVNIHARCLTYSELCYATENFNPNNQLGEGGFGRVYKGNLESIDQVVAVKQLDRNGFQGNREFLVEVMMLSLLDNPFLVDLVGYCCEGKERVLVYEYMPNGSLENHLLDLTPGTEPLDWNSRIKIASGAARGLEYLHDKADPPVIYRDFKASNVLLDNEFNPKLSDFGLAKIGPRGASQHVSTRVMGTYGYCAPEYALTGQLTKKSDVYSFGVVFLEMVTGKRVIDKTRPVDEQNLVTWATPLFQDRSNFETMVDPLLAGKYPSKGLIQAFAIAAMCLHEDTNERPSMGDVVSGLECVVLNKDGKNE